MKRNLWLILTLLLLVPLCAACSAMSSEPTIPPPPADIAERDNYLGMTDSKNAPDAGGADAEQYASLAEGGFSYETEADAGYTDVTLAVDPNRKLIRTGNLHVESLEFDRARSVLNTLVGTYGGYIESSDVTGVSKTRTGQENLRSATYTVRIPSAQFDAFLNRSGELGNVLNSTTGSTDVTDQYFDTEAHLKTLEMERLMLQEEFDKTTKMPDRITLLDKLRNVQYEIEKLTGTLRKYDVLVEYATITVRIEEVVEISAAEPVAPEPKTLGQRISQSFSGAMDSLKTGGANFLVWFVGALPFLLIWGAVIFVAVILIRKFVRRAQAAGPVSAVPPDVYPPAPPTSGPVAPPPPAPEESDKR